MTQENEDLSDAESRNANARFRTEVERKKSSEPGYAYAPRWIPTGNWRMSWFDLIVMIVGFGILLLMLGMRLFGIIH